MFSRTLLILMVALGGAGLAMQMAWNARLRVETGSPVLTTLISVLVTFLSLALVWASGTVNRGAVPAFQAIPAWAWFGGVFAGFYLVISLIAIPKLGAAAVFSLVIAGQLLGALALDTTGAFAMTPVPLSPARVSGAVLLLAGVILMQKR